MTRQNAAIVVVLGARSRTRQKEEAVCPATKSVWKGGRGEARKKSLCGSVSSKRVSGTVASEWPTTTRFMSEAREGRE